MTLTPTSPEKRLDEWVRNFQRDTSSDCPDVYKKGNEISSEELKKRKVIEPATDSEVIKKNVCATFAKAGISSLENIRFFKRHALCPKSVSDILNHLQEAKLLTQENFEKVIRYNLMYAYDKDNSIVRVAQLFDESRGYKTPVNESLFKKIFKEILADPKKGSDEIECYVTSQQLGCR